MKRCSKCKQLKLPEEFNKRKQSKDGLASRCRDCMREDRKLRRRDNQNHKLRSRYGISLKEYELMLERQEFKCACCGTSDAGGKHKRFNVDHCHRTGDVRALLCKDCNIVLGIVRDSPEHLERLTDYVLHHSPHRTSAVKVFEHNNLPPSSDGFN